MASVCRRWPASRRRPFGDEFPGMGQNRVESALPEVGTLRNTQMESSAKGGCLEPKEDVIERLHGLKQLGSLMRGTAPGTGAARTMLPERPAQLVPRRSARSD
jgi:hypothetical protein